MEEFSFDFISEYVDRLSNFYKKLLKEDDNITILENFIEYFKMDTELFNKIGNNLNISDLLKLFMHSIIEMKSKYDQTKKDYDELLEKYHNLELRLEYDNDKIDDLCKIFNEIDGIIKE